MKKYEIYTDLKRETGMDYSSNLFVRKLKEYCALKGYVYNPATLTGQKEDGKRYKKRIGDKFEDFCYIQSLESLIAQQKAAEQDLAF